VRVCSVALGMTALSASVRADDVEAIISRGVELRRQGRDADALLEFQRAVRLRDTPRARAQTALAEQALGLWVAAEADLLDALVHKNDPWIEKNAGTLGTALVTIQSHLGSLEIWGTPAGAAILVDMKEVGTLPLMKPIRVSGDSVLVVVRSAAFMETSRSIRVVAGALVREHVELLPLIASSNLARSNEDTRTSVPGIGVVSTQAESETATSSSRLRPWAWGLGVAALAGTVLGVVETKLAVDKEHRFNDHTVPNPSDPTHPIKDCNTFAEPSDCVPLDHDYRSSVRLAIVGYAVGGALAIGSTLLFAFSSGRERASRSALTCAPELTRLGLGCRFVF
jgi:hypothetical protein